MVEPIIGCYYKENNLIIFRDKLFGTNDKSSTYNVTDTIQSIHSFNALQSISQVHLTFFLKITNTQKGL